MNQLLSTIYNASYVRQWGHLWTAKRATNGLKCADSSTADPDPGGLRVELPLPIHDICDQIRYIVIVIPKCSTGQLIPFLQSKVLNFVHILDQSRSQGTYSVSPLKVLLLLIMCP
jgi:hypothetical protein